MAPLPLDLPPFGLRPLAHVEFNFLSVEPAGAQVPIIGKTIQASGWVLPSAKALDVMTGHTE